MTSLAIIVCTWNRAATLDESLRSLQQVRIPEGVSVDVLVVDNNSNDGTAAVVEALRPQWQLGTLRYLFEGRQGKQFALNTGIKQSDAELLAFTDDDIVFPQDWIANIVAAFADPQLELTGGKTLLTWPGGGAPVWFDRGMEAILAGVDIGDVRMQPPPPGFAPAGSNMMVRRRVFERVGGFSETHFRHMDYEFGQRCAKAGVSTSYDPSLVVYAPVDAQLLSKRYFRRWSFKAGISRDDAGKTMATFLAVPRWLYRQLLQDLCGYPFDLLLRSPREAFTRELRMWRTYGTISSRWYASLWPDEFPKWVEKYSQKKKNVY
jgi:glycosyltransferase involved in cell wall biosynthesis